MKTTQAQRLLLFMGIVGAFALLMSSLAFFGAPVGDVGLYSVDGLRARIATVPKPSVDLSFLIAMMGLPLLVAGTTGWMLELQSTSKATRWTMMAGVGVWILTLGAFLGGIRITSSALGHLPADVVWPSEIESILRGLSWLARLSTLGLWAGLAWRIWQGALPVPKRWALASPGVVVLGTVALAALWSLWSPQSRAAAFAIAPWAALMVSFASLLIVRLRRPLASES